MTLSNTGVQKAKQILAEIANLRAIFYDNPDDVGFIEQEWYFVLVKIGLRSGKRFYKY